MAQRVIALRKERDWSARDLADQLTAAGFPTKRAALANFENGRRRDVTIGELFAFARVFGVPPILLFGGPLDRLAVVPTGAAPDAQSPAPEAALTVVELLDWISGAWLPNAVADDEGRDTGAYDRAAEPLAAYRRHTELLDEVIGAYLALPDGRGLDLYKQPLDELARHRNMMRSRGWTLPAITPEHLVDELTPAIEAAEQRATAAYPRHSHPRTITPKENDR